MIALTAHRVMWLSVDENCLVKAVVVSVSFPLRVVRFGFL